MLYASLHDLVISHHWLCSYLFGDAWLGTQPFRKFLLLLLVVGNRVFHLLNRYRTLDIYPLPFNDMFIFQPKDCVDAPDIHKGDKAKASGLVRPFVNHYLGLFNRSKIFKVALENTLVKVLRKTTDENFPELCVYLIGASDSLSPQLLQCFKCFCIQTRLLTRHSL